MRGVAAADVRRWRAHRSYLTRVAPDVATAAAAVPPLPATPAAYVSLHARVEGFGPQALDEFVFEERALRPYPLWRVGPVLVPAEWIAPLEALHVFRARSGARRSRVWRRREEAYAARAPRARELLGPRPQTAAEIASLGGLGSGAAEFAGDLGELLADMAGRGDAVMGFAGRSLARAELTFASPASPDHIAPTSTSSYGFLEDLALHYFRAAGPATRDDFVWWASISYSSARHTIEDLAGLLEELDIEGERKAHFMPEEDAADLRAGAALPSRRVALLPLLDPARTATEAGFASLCDPRLAPKVAPPGRRTPAGITGGARPAMVGGAAVGVWHWKPGDARIEVTMARELDEPDQDAVDRAAASLAELVAAVAKVGGSRAVRF